MSKKYDSFTIEFTFRDGSVRRDYILSNMETNTFSVSTIPPAKVRKPARKEWREIIDV